MHDFALTFRSPPADLAPWVLGLAERRDATSCDASHELPIPNAMLQFMLGGDYLIGQAPVPRAALWGPTSAASRARTSAPAHVFMVMLSALGAAALSRMEIAHLMDERLAMEDMGARWSGLDDRLAEAADFDERVLMATDHLRGVLHGQDHRPNAILAMADSVTRHTLRAPVSAMADLAGMSPRGLNKAFIRSVGCGPKRLLRVARLQRVLRALHPSPWSPDAPHDPFLEYTDQAHLDRDFLDLTGLTRSSYVATKRERRDRLVHTVV
ncbi:hypothetical protein [Brevundimonas sp. Root1423]|uniref:hypothetical protein n=1 Tax=Brevundimonas sp. Root1423 TaxID=1736462 RepID=UPI0006F3C86A|nr:hypothetical protein [Brevundimonas sp. Root1423]KQY75256.1 hypothetical protein ASD25_11900 [Brevundimonas sp. Root1423]